MPKKFLLICLLFLSAHFSYAESKPDLFLLQTYDGSQQVTGWVMSEKLDGVRGVWDGEKLQSRNGNLIHAPAWFIKNFPPFALDGELWTARGEFEEIVSIVRRQTPDERWSRINYHIFEVPQQDGGLLERLSVLQDYLRDNASVSNRIKIIPQRVVENKESLREFLGEVTGGGGEGIVVRNPETLYQTGRLASALKVKTYQDAECIVEKILPGKGKYTGKMGALECRMEDRRLVKIGSGFSDQNRAEPPPIGDIITFKYYGVTGNGKPRFPVYLRRRQH